MTDLYDQVVQFARMNIDRGAYDLEAPRFDTAPEPLLETLEAADCGVIAEVRVAEPAMGRIPKDMGADRSVREMLRRGADAIGVMTEQTKFGGNLDLIGLARQGAPVIMRDFVIDEAQVQAAEHAGASAITLDAGLERAGHADLDLLMDRCESWDLESVVLVHDEDDLDVAEAVDPDLLGVVQKDPVTRDEDLELAGTVLEATSIPTVVVGGIRDADDLAAARDLGATAVWVDGPLVGHDEPWTVIEAIAGEDAS